LSYPSLTNTKPQGGSAGIPCLFNPFPSAQYCEDALSKGGPFLKRVCNLYPNGIVTVSER